MTVITVTNKVMHVVNGNDEHVFCQSQVALRIRGDEIRLYGPGSEDGIKLTLPLSFDGASKATVADVITSVTTYLNT